MPPERRKAAAARPTDAGKGAAIERAEPGNCGTLRWTTYRASDNYGIAEDLRQSRAAKSRKRHPRILVFAQRSASVGF